MAFLRRSISTVFTRVIGGQRFRHTVAASSLSRQTNTFLLPPRTGFTSRRNYSDKKLLDTVNSEIESTLVSNQQYKPVVEAPEDFPFKIKEEPWMNNITLVREYKGDTVTVKVELKDDEEKSSDSRLRLHVTVDAVDDTSLEFWCTVLPNKITIDFLEMDTPSFGDAPPFKDMGKNLQEALHEYLEVRGVNMSTANFLREYVTNYLSMKEDNRVYLSLLKGLKHLFIRA